MPKKLHIQANERVDLVDFERAANEYTSESVNLRAKSVILDKKSRIIDGFRVQIDTSPGQVTVFNGHALDREGRLLLDESSPEESVTLTLTGASTTFYLEVEFTEQESDSDARMFWDPSFDNGGAPTPNGKEFSLTAPTRKTSTWKLVQPVSTTGFEVTTNPNSTRIPLAKLRTDATNTITVPDNPGLVVESAASVLLEDVNAGSSTLHVQDARYIAAAGEQVFIDYGDATVETKTVASVDRTNGTITLTVALGNNHSLGAIVRNVTAGLFMAEKEDPSSVADHPDNTPRLYQLNERAAIPLVQSKTTYGGRNDLNVRSDKNQQDLFAGLIREMKFGNIDPGVTSTAPPTEFSTRPRYTDNAGSIAGARTASVTIGDGINTFGDFNGNDEIPFIAALNALSITGGSIYVKAGTYSINNVIAPSTGATIRIIGESFNTVTLQNNVVGSYAVDLDSGGFMELSHMHLTVGTGGSIVVRVGAASLLTQHLTVTGGIQLDAAASVRSLYTNIQSSVASTPAITFAVGVGQLEFVNCYFSATSSTDVLVGSVVGSYYDCAWGAGLNGIVPGAADSSEVIIRGGSMSVSESALRVSGQLTATLDGVQITGTSTTAYGAVLSVEGVSGVAFVNAANCVVKSSSTGVSVGAPGSFFRLASTSATPSSLTVTDCKFSNNTPTNHLSCIYSTALQSWLIIANNCYTSSLSSFETISNIGPSVISVDNLSFDGGNVLLEQRVFHVDGAVGDIDLSVTNSKVVKGTISGAQDKYFALLASSAGPINVDISNCSFFPDSSSAAKYFLYKGLGGGFARISNCEASMSGTSIYFVRDLSSSEVTISDNIISDCAATDVLDLVHCNTGGLVDIHDNIFGASLSTSGSADTFAIHVLSTKQALVHHNQLSGVDGNNITTSAAISVNCSALGNCDISHNDIDLAAGLGTGLAHGILVNITNTSHDVSVCDNVVRGGSETVYNIYTKVSLSGDQSGELKVDRNTIITGANYTAGVLAELGDCRSASCSYNHVSESAKNLAAFGIDVVGTASITRCVVVNGNTLRGKNGTGDRIFSAVIISGVITLSCADNSILWDEATKKHSSIRLFDVRGAMVIGNSVGPSADGAESYASISVGGTSSHFGILSNVATDGTTAGTIFPVSAPLLSLIDNNVL